MDWTKSRTVYTVKYQFVTSRHWIGQNQRRNTIKITIKVTIAVKSSYKTQFILFFFILPPHRFM